MNAETPDRKPELAGPWLAASVLVLTIAYGMQVVDATLGWWPSWKLDYSTHSAFAIGLIVLWSFVSQIWLALGAIIFVLYATSFLREERHIVMSRLKTSSRAFAFTLTIILTACSADSPETQSTAGSATSVTKYYACDFLTARAISSQLDKPFAEGRKTNESGGGKNRSHMTTCTWEAQANATGVSPADMLNNSTAVILMLWSYPDAQRGKEYLESFREVAQETGEPMPTPVAIGDEALLDGTSVHVRKGTAAFTVTVRVYEAAEQAAAGKHAEVFARQVAARL